MGYNLHFEINEFNELVPSFHVHESKPILKFSEWLAARQGGELTAEQDTLADCLHALNVVPHVNEVRGDELREGEYFTWTGATQRVLRVTGQRTDRSGTGSLLYVDEEGESNSYPLSCRFVRIHRGQFKLPRSPIEMSNSEAVQAVFEFILANTPQLKETISSANKTKAIGIFKDAIKGGFAAFTEGLMFAVDQELGPDKTVRLYISKAGNSLAFKVTNFRDLIARYFYGEPVPDVAPPDKEKDPLLMHDPVKVTFVDGSSINMKYIGNMGTKIWGRGDQGELLTYPKTSVATIKRIS